MHGIGNFHDAQTILYWVQAHRSSVAWKRPSCVYDRIAPEGWELVGSGTDRSVWRSPEGVGYKVQHSDVGQCVGEIEKLKEVWHEELLDGVRLPQFESYEVEDETVVAIELIDGLTLGNYRGPNVTGFYDLMHKVEREYSLYDMHEDNCIVELSTGKLVPVDFG
jgi:hypothetical protein